MKKILFIVSTFVSFCLLTACSDTPSSGEAISKYEKAFQDAIGEYVEYRKEVGKSGTATMGAKKNKTKKAKYDKDLADLSTSIEKVNESGTKYFEELQNYANGLTDAKQKANYEKRIKTAKVRFTKEKSRAEKTMNKLKKFNPQKSSKNVNAIVEYAALLNPDGKEFKGVIVKNKSSEKEASPENQ